VPSWPSARLELPQVLLHDRSAGETMEDVLAISEMCRRVLEVGPATPRWQGPGEGEHIDLRAEGVDAFMCQARIRLSRSRPRWPPCGRRCTVGAGSSLAQPVQLDPGGCARTRRPPTECRRSVRACVKRRFDAWDEHFSGYERWLEAFEEEGPRSGLYAQRDIPLDSLCVGPSQLRSDEGVSGAPTATSALRQDRG